MTPAQPTPDQINAAINTAARGMTSGAPSPNLRARVMSRIDAPAPRWGWRIALAGGAVASVAVLVATLLVSPESEAPAVVAVAPPMATGPVSPEPEAKANPTVVPVVSSPLLSTGSVQRAATRRAVFSPSAEELEWRARAVQALEQPVALQVAPLQHERFNIEPIDITPLSVAPLTVPGMGGTGNR